MATLGDKAVGDIIKIKENGTAVNYIIVHKGLPGSMYDSSCNGVWLLREYSLRYTEQWDSNDTNDYENSTIHSYLNDEVYYTFNSKTMNAIKSVKIPYVKGIADSYDPLVQKGADGLSCKVFLLSGCEVGLFDSLPYDGNTLSYFLDGESTAANAKRVCHSSSNTIIQWWLRSPRENSTRNIGKVYTSGALSVARATDNLYVRPAFILPATQGVDSSGNLVFNTAPTISGSSSSGSNLGEKSAPFNFTYTVRDADNDTVTVKEYLDNVLQRSYTASLGATNTFQATYNSGTFQKILNGSHTIKITATDSAGNSSAAYTVTFNKQVKTATITLSTPLPADDLIKAAVVTVTGNIPQDATLEVFVTNNARDSSPVWEDMSRDVQQGVNHLFTNKTAANGFAFNFKVTVTRGVSGTQGYISNIGGAFE